MRHAPHRFVGITHPPQNLLGKPGADDGMAFEMRHAVCIDPPASGFAEIMEKHAKPQRFLLRRGVERRERVVKYVVAVVRRVLLAADKRGKLGQEHL